MVQWECLFANDFEIWGECLHGDRAALKLEYDRDASEGRTPAEMKKCIFAPCHQSPLSQKDFRIGTFR